MFIPTHMTRKFNSECQRGHGLQGHGDAGGPASSLLPPDGDTGGIGETTGAQPMTHREAVAQGANTGWPISAIRAMGVRKRAQVPASGVTSKTCEHTMGQEAGRRNKPKEHSATWLHLRMKYQHSTTSIYLKYSTENSITHFTRVPTYTRNHLTFQQLPIWGAKDATEEKRGRNENGIRNRKRDRERERQ